MYASKIIISKGVHIEGDNEYAWYGEQFSQIA
jgi:hypothetical protein